MRKISFIMAALALVLGISQCKKQEEPAASGQKQHIVLNASFGDSNAKIAEDGTGGLKWTDEDGHKDIIKVYNSSETEIGTLECTDAAKGTFEGDITASEDQITFTFGTKLNTYEHQTGDLKDAIYLESAKIDYRADGNYGEVKMNMPHAVLKLDLSALGTADGNLVTITAYENPVASVENVTDEVGKVYYVAMPAAESTIYTFSGNDKAGSVYWPLAANTFYTGYNSTSAIEIKPVGGEISDFDGCETNDNLEFNFTIKPDDGCNIVAAVLCFSLDDNDSPNYDDNTDKIDCEFPYNTVSISKDDLIYIYGYESGKPIYFRLYVEFLDFNGYGPKVIDYSYVKEISFTFEEEE